MYLKFNKPFICRSGEWREGRGKEGRRDSMKESVLVRQDTWREKRDSDRVRAGRVRGLASVGLSV